ncbi:MAG TPA: ABC transporter permease subunit, partial [Candidatus Acidoferrum sp.]|nr:ABC transporter permease subunit [Candidatus Acidoferrum sp.]
MPADLKSVQRSLLLALFLGPALLLLGAIVVYPICFTVIRSLYDRSGDAFVGFDNYRRMLALPEIVAAIRNNILWVVVAPSAVTAMGLVLAVLTERIRWRTAFRVVLFMPMAVSFLSAGVIWRLAYQRDPSLGLANAIVRVGVNLFRPPGPYFGARPSVSGLLSPAGEGFLSTRTYRPGDVAGFGLVAIPPSLLQNRAAHAISPRATASSIQGVVWLDFTLGGGGQRGVIDPSESGLPGVRVQALLGRRTVADVVTGADGGFLLADLPSGEYRLRLNGSSFRAPFDGIPWLGPTLVTPAIILSYIWIWAGFSMVVIGAGLATLPREVLEACRVDGAGEWQIFRRVTVPLLAPAITVVFVTLVINVLKIFDLVLVIPPGSALADANVIALEMWRVSFGGIRDLGLGSALA